MPRQEERAEETAGLGDVHRQLTLIARRSPRGACAERVAGRANRKEGHVRGGIRHGSSGARGTRRLLKTRRGILLAPGVSSKDGALSTAVSIGSPAETKSGRTSERR